MNSDLQILFSFAITMLGAVLLIAAYFEAGEFELDFEEIELDHENEPSAQQHYRDY